MDPDRGLDRRSLLTLVAATGLAAAGPGKAASSPEPPPEPWTRQGAVDRPAGRIHYVELGPVAQAQAEPLILLHKLGGWAADWRKIAPLLAAHRRVVAIDLPGHGDSLMRGPAPYVQTVPETAAMLKAVLDELGLDRVSIVGSSLGGVTGVVMAACWPQFVRRLALISVSLIPAHPRAELAAMDAAVRDQFGPDWEPLPRTAASLGRFGSLDPAITDENNLSRARAGAWVRASERGVAVAGVTDYLPRIACPTLLVYADRGLYQQFEAVGRAGLKTVAVEHVPGSGSFTYQDKPAETAAILNRFLA